MPTHATAGRFSISKKCLVWIFPHRKWPMEALPIHVLRRHRPTVTCLAYPPPPTPGPRNCNRGTGSQPCPNPKTPATTTASIDPKPKPSNHRASGLDPRLSQPGARSTGEQVTTATPLLPGSAHYSPNLRPPHSSPTRGVSRFRCFWVAVGAFCPHLGSGAVQLPHQTCGLGLGDGGIPFCRNDFGPWGFALSIQGPGPDAFLLSLGSEPQLHDVELMR